MNEYQGERISETELGAMEACDELEAHREMNAGSRTVSESLYRIEETLEQLHHERIAAEAEADSESVKTIDQAIQDYLEVRKPEKIDSYCGLIRREESSAEECEAEANRLKGRAKAKRALVIRLHELALYNMQRMDVTKLETATNTMRIQPNGGVEKLEVNSDLIPQDYTSIAVEFTFRQWEWVRKLIGLPRADSEAIQIAACRAMEAGESEPQLARIREALKMRVKCSECNGIGANFNNSSAIPCPRCEGTGTIPASVPGAKLHDRGVHLRIE